MSTAHVDNHDELTRKASSIVTVLYRCMTGEDPATFSSGNVSALPVAAAHGYPSTKTMHANIASLRALNDLPVTFTIATQEGPAMTTTPRDGIEVLLEHAASHDKRAIRNAALRITGHVERLRELIDADREDAKRREKIARLEAEIAALKGRKTRAQTPAAPGDVPCPIDDCNRTFASKQAAAMHKRRAHDGFDPNAAASAA